VNDSGEAVLLPPDGWAFRVMAWAWEDDDHLVSPVVRDGGDADRMVRCGVQSGVCVLIGAP
jgi:hypothetical protein